VSASTWYSRTLAALATCCLFGIVPQANAQLAKHFRITWQDLKTILDDNLDGRVSAEELSNRKRIQTLITKLLDKNSDRALSKNELLGARELLEADTNGNHSVSQSELAAWLAAWRKQLAPTKNAKPGGQSAKLISLATLLDANGDGELTAGDLADITAASEKVLAAVDANGDEFLSVGEVAKVEEPLGEADADLDKLVSVDELIDWLIQWNGSLNEIVLATVLDHNGDGHLTAADLADMTWAMNKVLEAVDANGDEFLSLSEMASVREPIQDADYDVDELVSVDELIFWLIAWRRRLGQVVLTQLLDTNGDGSMGAEDLKDLAAAWQKLLATLDVNGDEFISHEELEIVAEPLRNPDADHDGLVSVDELVSWLSGWRDRLPGSEANRQAAPSPVPAKPVASSLSQWLDRDGDGLVSANDLADLDAAWRAVMKGLDANSDEFLSKDEIKNIREPLAAADLDVDGLISVDELVDWLTIWQTDLRKASDAKKP